MYVKLTAFALGPALLLAFVLLVGARGDEPKWIPNTKAWNGIMDRRYEQIKQMMDKQEQFDALMNVAGAGALVPNYTEKGYKIVKTPPELHRALNQSLHAGLSLSRAESTVDQISGGPHKNVYHGVNDVLEQLLHHHEEWAGVKLTPSTAFGLRVYQPGNALTMHTDRPDTHVISSIIHVDRDVDEPWPIVIEGVDGVTAEVDLRPGEMLFYESAKCIHGRPRELKGRWYASLFVHYRPVDWQATLHQQAKNWAEAKNHHSWIPNPESKVPTLRMKGTGLFEPGCPHGWCSLASTWPPEGGANVAFVPFGDEASETEENFRNFRRFGMEFRKTHGADISDAPKRVKVLFVNNDVDGLQLFYVPPEEPPVLIDGAWARGAIEQATFEGHVFEVRTAANTGASLVARWVIGPNAEGRRFLVKDYAGHEEL